MWTCVSMTEREIILDEYSLLFISSNAKKKKNDPFSVDDICDNRKREILSDVVFLGGIYQHCIFLFFSSRFPLRARERTRERERARERYELSLMSVVFFSQTLLVSSRRTSLLKLENITSIPISLR